MRECWCGWCVEESKKEERSDREQDMCMRSVRPGQSIDRVVIVACTTPLLPVHVELSDGTR